MSTMAMAVTTTPFRGFLCNHSQQLPPKLSFSSHPFPLLHRHQPKSFQLSPKFPPTPITPCSATRSSLNSSKRNSQLVVDDDEDTTERKKLIQSVLWVMEGVYIVWLFLLPYAPGDPVWAISSDTIKSLVGLSLNFFFILPIANSGSFKSTVGPVLISFIFYISDRVVGIHAMEAPVLHPMSEGLFNFVVGWTFMFAPLLYTDFKNNRYKGSLDVLWGLQMFLTNTFLIPYMAIRLNKADESTYPKRPSQLGTVMIKGAPVVGLIGGVVCAISLLWSLYGRLDGDFGNVTDRWNFLLEYLGSERLAYAFIWDIVLYMIFQPWLIGENLANIAENKVELVKYIRYIPVVGLLAYLLCLKREVLEQFE